MADTFAAPAPSRRVSWPLLVIGMIVAGAAGLSVHVVMIEAMGIAYPADSASPPWARCINMAGSIAALVAFYNLAGPWMARRPFAVRCLVVFALYAMLKETLRGLVMNGVVTGGWAFSLVQALPDLTFTLIAAVLVVAAAPRLPRGWRLVGGAALGALLYFAVQPAVGMAFSPLMEGLSYLAQPDKYQLPYPMVVMVPAYLTFAEPALACAAMAALAWDRLSPSPLLRLAQFAALVLFIKGAVFRVLLYSLFIKADLPTAMLSEGQFTLEFIALAVLTGLVWQAARGKGRPAL